MKKDVYVTLDTYGVYINIWPATVGIRKFHGCCQYGAAWNAKEPRGLLTKYGRKYSMSVTKNQCQEWFGFYPFPGEAWFVPAKGKRVKVELKFSP